METTFVVPAPLDVAQTLSRFQLWGEDPVNQLGAHVFHRALHVEGRWYGYRLRWTGGPDGTRLTVSLPKAARARAVDAAVAEVRHICGLDLDVAGFYRAAHEDPVLGGLVSQLYGLRPTLSPGAFEMLVGSVCAQQVNLAFAFTVRGRLVRRFGVPVPLDGDTVYGFPEPSVVARASVAELRNMQLTTRKAEYIVGLARAIVSGELDVEALRTQTNEEIIQTLTTVRGLGRWTAEWFLARGLGRGDVCPAGDLGVRKAFAHFYHRGREVSEETIRRRAAKWRSHQNLAVHYLLAGQRLGAKTRGDGI
jgi:DNA-3-methyladenine glycosylase II